jgi:hypothetical protein
MVCTTGIDDSVLLPLKTETWVSDPDGTVGVLRHPTPADDEHDPATARTPVRARPPRTRLDRGLSDGSGGCCCSHRLTRRTAAKIGQAGRLDDGAGQLMTRGLLVGQPHDLGQNASLRSARGRQ